MVISEYLKKINQIKSKDTLIYIYGAGRKGVALFGLLSDENIMVNGFVVSNKDENKKEEAGLMVTDIHDLRVDDNKCLFLIGVRSRWNESVINTLRTLGYSHYIEAPDGIEYIGARDMDRSERPVLQITAQIGCRINCKYCPQKLFIDKYTEKTRETVMSFSTFMKCIDNTSMNTIIEFAGFSEPFFNVECINMIRYVAERGYDIELFSTFEGLTLEGFEEIKDIPYREMVLHIPDEKQNSKISVNEDYIALIKTVLETKKKNGEPFVDWCSCHGKPDRRIEALLGRRFRVLTQLHDRAGNVHDLKVETTNMHTGPIYCSGSRNLDHNVLLPDGSVLLCDSDWGMKHIIGNLLNQTYEDILNGKELNNIRKCMADNGDVICRNCCYAVERKSE